MRFTQHDDYPLCGRYLRNFMSPSALKKGWPRVWEAFVLCCEDEKRATQALEFNNDPIVKIADITNYGVHKTCAFTYPEHSAIGYAVFVHYLRADAYEKGRGGWLEWESSVLHEIVHWVRYQAGKNSEWFDDPDQGTLEAGQAFELRAYTKLQCTSDAST
jgi:hypothetical protein